MKELKMHKDLNREPIIFEKELGVRFYKEIIYKFNKLEDLHGEVIFSFQELRDNFNLQNPEVFKEFIKYFHTEINGRTQVFKTDKGDLIGGGVFSTMVYTKENKIGAMINPYHKQYIFSKIDIENWHSVKGNQEKIKTLDIQEEEKIKLTGMMTTFVAGTISGKYNQRLVDLLMQFNGSGFFAMKWDEFKKIMGIPETYVSSAIDVNVLKPCVKELKKIGINISKIEKIKKSNRIESIKFVFNYRQIKEKTPTNIKEVEYIKPVAQLTEFEKEKGRISKIVMKKRNTTMLMNLAAIATMDELDNFKKENEIQ